jgi:hypothetical protein
MTGIVPNVSSGGLPIGSANVSNVGVLPATFTLSCAQLGLPNDCTAKITPAQINAMVSELMNLAACFAPTGTWTCSSLTNLCSAFNSYVDGTGTNTLQGDVLKALDWKDCAGNQHLASATIPTCAEVAALIAAQTPLIVSPDADNMIVEDADGQAYLSPLQAVNAVLADVAAKCALTNGIQKDLVTTALGIGDVPFPVGTENYGLNVSTSPECELYVPYASDVNRGVVEFINTTEASQDHNLPTGNALTLAGGMSALAELDDVRVMTARRTLDFLQNNFYIQASRVYAIPSARFTTLNELELYLRDHYIAPGVTITVNLAAGTHSLTTNLVGHPQGHRINIVGAALLATPVATDVVSTGNTVAALSADYTTSKANLSAKYATFVDAATVGGLVMNSVAGTSPYRWTNVYFNGRFAITSAPPQFNIPTFSTCVIDAFSNAAAALTITASPAIYTLDLFIISPTITISLQIIDNSTLFSFGAGAGLVCLGASTNIGVRRGSKLIVASKLKVVGALLFNMLVYEMSAVTVFDDVTISNASRYNIEISGNSNVNLGGSNVAVMLLSGAGIANIRLINAGSFAPGVSSIFASITFTNAPTGIICERSSDIMLFATAIAISNHSVAGISVSQGTVSLTTSVGAPTFTGNTVDISARDSSDVLIGPVVAPVTSPPVGTVGNNNSLIHV